MLHDAGIEFDELVLNRDFRESTIRAVSGSTTVPQIFIDGSLIGGSDDLEQYLTAQGDIAA
jgi:glutaredoxin